MAALHPNQIPRILELTDSFNLHRENILIPLATAEKGAVDLLPDGRLKITCPSGASLDAWLIELQEILRKMDLSKVRVI